MTADPVVVTAVPLKVGDRVLMCMADGDMTTEEVRHVRETLVERFTGVDFTIVAGVTHLAVQKDGAITDDLTTE